jgi:gamma-glutamylcyclotransferase (GGCT)/AIG2-like uncharacterized protein YtfP
MADGLGECRYACSFAFHPHDMNIFTYGSLMFPQVWERVVRSDYRATSARLDGYARFAIAGETYPGMVAQRIASVQGVLYFEIAPQDLAALDAFEGAEYRREPVQVMLESGEAVSATTYVYLLPQKLSASAWLPEAFQMERFIGT